MDKNVRNYICIFLARKFKSILLIFSLSTCRTFVTGGLEKVRKGVKVMVCKIRKKVTSTARLPPQCLKNLKKSHFFNIHQSHAFQKNIWIFCAQIKRCHFKWDIFGDFQTLCNSKKRSMRQYGAYFSEFLRHNDPI